MVDLGTLGRNTSSGATAMNNSGQVVGRSGSQAFSWTSEGGMVALGDLDCSTSFAVAVNSRGQVTGYSCTATEYHAVVWEPIANLGCEMTLAGCNLKGTNLAGAYLKDRNLSGADLKDANLARSNLTRANLQRANLKAANLANANLAGADLTGANVKDVIWSNTICPDGTNSDANGGTCVNHL